MSTLSAPETRTDALADALCAAEELLAQVVIAIGDAKTFAGTSRAEACEARLHVLVEDLAEEFGITVIPS